MVPDSIAWLRLFVHASHLSEATAWSPLWKAARAELAKTGGSTAAAIATQHWFEKILIDSGFKLYQHIVLLEWSDQPLIPALLPVGVKIRVMKANDLADVVDTDAAAFEPLWRNSFDALEKALSQAVYATVAEDASGVIGYQLSTGSSIGAHLARLAVRPEAQKRGLGLALVRDLIQYINRREGPSRITVNTQASNSSSLSLYHRLGFRRTGEQYPIYIFEVESE